MDSIDLYILRLHELIGHDHTAEVLGQDPGDKSKCLICAYERDPTPENKQAVEQALARHDG